MLNRVRGVREGLSEALKTVIEDKYRETRRWLADRGLLTGADGKISREWYQITKDEVNVLRKKIEELLDLLYDYQTAGEKA